MEQVITQEFHGTVSIINKLFSIGTNKIIKNIGKKNQQTNVVY